MLDTNTKITRECLSLLYLCLVYWAHSTRVIYGESDGVLGIVSLFCCGWFGNDMLFRSYLLLVLLLFVLHFRVALGAGMALSATLPSSLSILTVDRFALLFLADSKLVFLDVAFPRNVLFLGFVLLCGNIQYITPALTLQL